MSVLSSLRNYVRRLVTPRLAETDPEKAYNLWAAAYDAQPDNLMLALDEELFTDLLSGITITNKLVADIGCGTGRHWTKLLNQHPANLYGFDVSTEMLAVLKQKFPGQPVFRMQDHRIDLPDHSCDLLISTLAIAHIPDLALALAEWVRVLKPGGEIIITDYHPEALARGGNRTFRHKDQLVAVKNYVHTIEQVTQIARQLDLQVLRISERRIDEQVKAFYEKQQALPVYEKFKGTPIIYGIHLKSNDAAT